MAAVTPSIPTFQAAGTSQSGTGALTVAWPTHATNDVALLVVDSLNETVSLSSANGFVQLTNSPQASGGLAKIAVFWCVATSSSMSAPVVAANTLVRYARIYTFRGCSDVQPIVTAANGSSSGTAVTINGATALAKNTLVALIVAYGDATTTPQLSGWTNSNLGSITQRGDESVIGAAGAGLATGTFAAGGAYGNSTATLGTSSPWAAMSVALQPAWMVDATSVVAIPQSNYEHTQFLAAAALVYAALATVAAGNSIWRCQETSGNITDYGGGGITLTASGASLAYASTVAAWSTKGISFTDGAAGLLQSTSASLPDVSTSSFASLSFVIYDTIPAAARVVTQIGGVTKGVVLRVNTTPVLRVQENNGTQTTGVTNPVSPSQVRPMLIESNFTLSSGKGHSDQERQTPIWSAPTTSKQIAWGSSTTAPGMRLVWACAWWNGSAELTDDQISALMLAHGFTPQWGALTDDEIPIRTPVGQSSFWLPRATVEDDFVPVNALDDGQGNNSVAPPAQAYYRQPARPVTLDDLPIGNGFSLSAPSPTGLTLGLSPATVALILNYLPDDDSVIGGYLVIVPNVVTPNDTTLSIVLSPTPGALTLAGQLPVLNLNLAAIAAGTLTLAGQLSALSLGLAAQSPAGLLVGAYVPTLGTLLGATTGTLAFSPATTTLDRVLLASARNVVLATNPTSLAIALAASPTGMVLISTGPALARALAAPAGALTLATTSAALAAQYAALPSALILTGATPAIHVVAMPGDFYGVLVSADGIVGVLVPQNVISATLVRK